MSKMFEKNEWAIRRLRALEASLDYQGKTSQALLNSFEDVFDYYCEFTKKLGRGALYASSPEAMIKFWESEPAERYLDAQTAALKKGATLQRVFIFSSPESLEDPDITKILVPEQV